MTVYSDYQATRNTDTASLATDGQMVVKRIMGTDTVKSGR